MKLVLNKDFDFLQSDEFKNMNAFTKAEFKVHKGYQERMDQSLVKYI